MKLFTTLLGVLVVFFSSAFTAYAAVDPGITTYTNDTLNIITVIATAAVVFFLVKGGYLYITSTGKPDALEHAKKTIKNALIGLVLVLGSTILVNILTNAFTPTTGGNTTNNIQLVPLNVSPPSNG